jgi:hypothetical protein
MLFRQRKWFFLFSKSVFFSGVESFLKAAQKEKFTADKVHFKGTQAYSVYAEQSYLPQYWLNQKIFFYKTLMFKQN